MHQKQSRTSLEVLWSRVEGQESRTGKVSIFGQCESAFVALASSFDRRPLSIRANCSARRSRLRLVFSSRNDCRRAILVCETTFHNRAVCDLKKSRELLVRRTPGACGDIGGDRYGGTPQLAGQAKAFVHGESFRRGVNVISEFDRLMPHDEPFESEHGSARLVERRGSRARTGILMALVP
jgi:hypothetical protein